MVLPVGVNHGLDRFAAGVVPPVGLHEHCVDLFEVHGSGAVAHGLDERAGAEVSNGPQDAFGDAQDEVECVVGEGVVGQPAEVELVGHLRHAGETVGEQSFDGGNGTSGQILTKSLGTRQP